jgi:uncharacterized protein YcfJ
VVVGCEPQQRAIVRPTVVNGAAVSQVECVSIGQPAPAAAAFAPAPLPVAQPAYQQPLQQQPVYQQVSARQPVYEESRDARVIPVSSPEPVSTRQTVYEREPVKRTRSVKKSAIIIGSSAGVGAGVGAAVGGKKGALIGAAIGGGGAAIWDQVTRRKD